MSACRFAPSLAVLVIALTLPALSAPAEAGRLGEFRDSIDRDNGPRERGRGGGGRNDSDDDRGGHGFYRTERGSYDEDHDGRLSPVLGAIFVGHTPGDTFNWGDSPYEGRGRVRKPNYASADLDLQLDGPLVRQGHFRGRVDGAMLSDGSAVGVGFFGLLESTYTPAISVSHLQQMDFQDSDRLGVTAIALEPRIYTSSAVIWRWNLGGVFYRSEEGVANAGLQIGMGFEVTPRDPLFFEGRFSTHIMSGLAVADVTLNTGVEVHDGVFAVVGYRGLLGPVLGLHTLTVGLQIDLGFGGRPELPPYTF